MPSLSEAAKARVATETIPTSATPSPAAAVGLPVESDEIAFDIKGFSLWYGQRQALQDVTIQIPARKVTAIIGPSGCGKSTFLRALNRMHELTPGTRLEGSLRHFGHDLYGPGVEAVAIRRRVGMVFQKSNPFPTMSIAENVLVGLRLNGVKDKAVLQERLEQSLHMAALWDEVKDHLNRPGTSLSGCTASERAAGDAPHGRALFGVGSPGNREDRGAHPGVARILYRRNCNPQHAASRQVLGPNGIFLHGPPY